MPSILEYDLRKSKTKRTSDSEVVAYLPKGAMMAPRMTSHCKKISDDDCDDTDIDTGHYYFSDAVNQKQVL